MSTTLVEPHLFFNGRCEEALEFHRTALGAIIEMRIPFKDSPVPHEPGRVPPGFENKVMQARFRIGATRRTGMNRARPSRQCPPDGADGRRADHRWRVIFPSKR